MIIPFLICLSLAFAFVFEAWGEWLNFGAGGGVESRNANGPSNSTDSDKVSCAGAQLKHVVGTACSRGSDRPTRTFSTLIAVNGVLKGL